MRETFQISTMLVIVDKGDHMMIKDKKTAKYW